MVRLWRRRGFDGEMMVCERSRLMENGNAHMLGL